MYNNYPTDICNNYPIYNAIILYIMQLSYT